jgi:hypothetical protein
VERTYGSGGSKAVKAVADSAFGGRHDPKAMKLVIKLAMSCLKPSWGSRPEMSKVVRVLRQAQAVELVRGKEVSVSYCKSGNMSHVCIIMR